MLRTESILYIDITKYKTDCKLSFLLQLTVIKKNEDYFYTLVRNYYQNITLAGKKQDGEEYT